MTTTEDTRGVRRPTNHPDLIRELWSDQSWLACDFPERPFDPKWTAYVSDCYSCFIAAVAAVRQGNGDSARDYGNASVMPLRECVKAMGTQYGHFDRAGIDPESF